MTKNAIRAEVFKGPFDPGGQPDISGANPLEVSLFAWNVRSGLFPNLAVLEDPPRYQDYWRWPSASRILRDADEVGFDHQVQYGMWSGYGGPSRWNDAGLDFATGAAASAAITKRLGLFSTVHVAYRFHPMHIAKIGACIDSISDGRWGLNIVAGQNPADFRKFGFHEPPPSAERYAIADEFTTLLKYLWTSEAPVDFEGERFQAYGAYVNPQPARKPRPILMNAGQSEAGLDFACRQADWVFAAPPSGKLGDFKKVAEKAHGLAAKYDRRVKVCAMTFCVLGDDDADAQRTVEYLEENVDREAVIGFLRSVVGTSHDTWTVEDSDPWAGVGREQFMAVGLGMTGFQLFGGPETVAETMRDLYDSGIEGMAVCFWDPQHAVRQMGERVFPLLKDMGLRN